MSSAPTRGLHQAPQVGDGMRDGSSLSGAEVHEEGTCHALNTEHLGVCHQGLRPCRNLAATTLAARQLPAELAAQRDPVSCSILSTKTPWASLSAERPADQRISDAGEPWGPGPAFTGRLRAGRRPRFSGLARAAVQQNQQQQQQTARTPQPPVKPPVSARDVVIAVDDTNDAQQAVEWAAGNVLKGGGCSLPSPLSSPHTPATVSFVLLPRTTSDCHPAPRAYDPRTLLVPSTLVCATYPTCAKAGDGPGAGDVLHLLHVLRDNRTNETEVGELSRSGYTWATPDYASRQVLCLCVLAQHWRRVATRACWP